MSLYIDSKIANIIYEGPLQLATIEQARDALGSEKNQEIEEAPYVSIGEPQIVNLFDVFLEADKAISPQIRVLLTETIFFLVRFACSFRLESDASIDWARFSITLECQNPLPSPAVAFALYPQ